MILVSQKRVVMGVCLGLLLVPSTPTQASRNTAGDVAVGCAIGAGILGLCGLAAGLCYAFSKSDEQVADEAFQALQAAQQDDRKFYSEYMNVFMRARYGEPSIDDIEQNFLFPIAERCFYSNFSMDSYISRLSDHKKALQYAAEQVAERMHKLERDYKTGYAVYSRFSQLRRDIESELSYLTAYYHKLAEHRAFFVLYAHEAQLYKTYAREMELGHQYKHDPYLFERYILQAVSAHNLHKDYPLVVYHNRLNEHIDVLSRHIQNLKYYYAGRTLYAQQLLDYLVYVRDFIAATSSFKEEKRVKKEEDYRRELLEIQRREADARDREVAARSLDAAARMAQAQAEHERNRIERRKLDNPTIVVVAAQ